MNADLRNEKPEWTIFPDVISEVRVCLEHNRSVADENWRALAKHLFVDCPTSTQGVREVMSRPCPPTVGNVHPLGYPFDMVGGVGVFAGRVVVDHISQLTRKAEEEACPIRRSGA